MSACWSGSYVRDLETEIERQRATIADLTAALSAADAAINPPDRGGISLATWNGRLKSATEKIRAALARAKGGPLTSVSTADLDMRDIALNRGPRK